jgi:hypothetical protein
MTSFLVNMVGFLTFALAGSFIMCGWYKVTREKMLLQAWSRFWEKKEGDRYVRGKMAHALSGCVYCYAGIYGSLIFWVVGYAMLTLTGMYIEFTWRLIVLWPMYLLTTVPLNGIIIKKVL